MHYFLQRKEKIFQFIKVFLYLVFASFVLLWPAFWNRFPLVFSDTGTYVSSGFRLVVPFDRPIGYGLFIHIFSLGASLWYVIYAQALMTAYLLWKFLGVFVRKHRFFIHVSLLVGLAAFSTLPWMVSQIMPDICTGLIFLIIFVFLFGEAGLFERGCLVLLMMLFLITHSANFLLSFGVLFFISLVVFFTKKLVHQRKEFFRRIVILAVVTLFAPAFFILSNYHQGYGLVMNPASYVFVMSRVNESGILDNFLAKNCQDTGYYLCSYQGHFPQNDGFIWNSDSPLTILGWQSSKPEYDAILHKVFATPSYVADFIGDSMYRSARLFLTLGMDNYFPYTPTAPAYIAIYNNFPEESQQYLQSRQYAGELQSVDHFASLFLIVALISFIALAVMIFTRMLKSVQNFFVYLVLVFLVGNAVIMATLSGIYGRYQERLVWLLPLSAAAFLVIRFLKD